MASIAISFGSARLGLWYANVRRPTQLRKLMIVLGTRHPCKILRQSGYSIELESKVHDWFRYDPRLRLSRLEMDAEVGGLLCSISKSQHSMLLQQLPVSLLAYDKVVSWWEDQLFKSPIRPTSTPMLYSPKVVSLK